MYEKNTGNASPFASLSGRCLLCPVCRAAGVGRCGAFAPRGPKPPPAEARRCGHAPQTSTPRYGAADLRVGILPEESISSVVHFFFCAFGLIQKHQKIKHCESSGCRHLRSLSGHKDCAVLHTRSGRSHKCRHSFRSFRSAIPQAESLLNEKRGIQIAINHCCAKRTTDSALRKSGKKNGRRLRRRKRGRKPSAVPRLFALRILLAPPFCAKRW